MNPQARLDTRTRVARLVAVALLPIVVLALLLTALWNPVDRLSTVRAAIVNLDEPVTVGDQYVPLGRQLAAGLISGTAPSTEQTLRAAPAGDTGYDWQITDSTQARAGLAEGTFAAVVTIPPGFSAAATSMSGDAAQARQATIDVATPPGGRVADAVIAQYVAGVATDILGSSLTETYVDNVLVGFTTMSEQLGEAVDGASQLADGATSAAGGAGQLADGASQLADGATSAAGGAGQLADGASQLADGAASAAGGAGQLADGADALAAGAGQLATGAHGIAGGIRESQAGAQNLATGVTDLAAGLTQAADGVQEAQDLVAEILPPVEELTGGLVSAAGDIQDAGTAITTQLTEQIDALEALGCTPDATETPCSVLPALLTLRDGVDDAVARLDDPLAVAGEITAGLDQVDDLVTGLSDAAAGATALGTGVQELADGLGDLAGGAGQVAQGADGLASGARDLATGARALHGGIGQVASGAGTLADGTGDLADGIGDLATGADGIATGTGGLADGIGALADGVSEISAGLGQAVDELPAYSDEDRATLASVIANPVASPGQDTLASGSTGPLFAVVALWLGALGLTTVVRPSAARLLGSTRGAARLAIADLAVPAGIGAVTGAAVGAILAAVEGPSLGAWAGLVAVGALVSVVFVVLHQGFTLLAGNLARGVSLLIAVLLIATGVVATVPGWLVTVADFLAVGAARQALVGLVVPGAGGTGAAVVALVAWGLAGVGLTVFMTARARTVRVSRLLAAA